LKQWPRNKRNKSKFKTCVKRKWPFTALDDSRDYHFNLIIWITSFY